MNEFTALEEIKEEKVIDYDVITSDYLDDLIGRVKERVLGNWEPGRWEPSGGIFVYRHPDGSPVFYQAMVKKT